MTNVTAPAVDSRPQRLPDGRRVRIVWNPDAGSKGGIPTNGVGEADLRRILAEHGLDDDIVVADDERRCATAIEDAVGSGFDIVVAAGGDGTVDRVAGALLGSRTALGILPMGSVMNVARSLGVPRDLDAAAAVIADGWVTTIDIGAARGEPFYEAGSIGLNAAMFREAQRFDDGDWWSIVRTIWVALRYRPARMRLRLDDRVIRTRALMVTVANGPYTGLGMMVAPSARLDDGRFDVRVFRGFSKWELLRHLGSIAFGRRRYAPRVSTYRSRRVEVTSRHPLPCRADGRDLGVTPVTFEVRPQALRAVIPAPTGTTDPS
jgi:diacylglycerol kinase (ATP)